MRFTNGLMAILLVFFFTAVVHADNTEKENAALRAAESWLSLVDAGEYGGSWEETCAYFKGVVKKEQWIQQLEGARKPLGRVLSRNVKDMVYKTSLPGAPDGQYVIIEFDTSFENKKSAVETVTPMLDAGTWKVSGYYIR